ncbi:LssY C-terminal domain-containing protein [Acaricomes phytoseiuli]|uniref:LssY C-terminal domain-containing protein n=1 Tax=Acaricomes phytoseiuli TaxID=291968 RepID=UPI0003747CFA|nr:LssY C-terminal domain-containing protein [Acaricomes phytoseiuli]MCW1248868.1 LssY C-terminal domain-containing protein [Acaricomes phytoseiuli]
MLKTDPAQPKRRPWSVNVIVDNFFVIFSGATSVWLAWLVFSESFGTWTRLWYLLPFWLILAYVTLPRLHKILSGIYVPDYFIGRSRTTDGLLGDPINLAVCGSQEQLETVMAEAGWTKADEISLRSSWRIVLSTITGRSYDEAPVSTLNLFGRQQDFAYQQEVENSPAKRHHVRFWRCPEGWLLPGGYKADWLAAGTFDRSVGFSLFTFQITHKIEENIDIERDHIVASMRKANPEVKVRVIEDFSTGYHSRNGGGDAIITDGDLPIVNISEVQPVVPKPRLSEQERAEVPGTDVEVPALPRPLPTVFGALFALFTAVTGVISSILTLNNDSFAEELLWNDPDADGTQLHEQVLIASVVFTGILALIRVAFAYFVWKGSNWARITLTATTSLSILVTFFAVIQGVQRLNLDINVFDTNLITLTLEILLVLALSSDRARAFARHRRG